MLLCAIGGAFAASTPFACAQPPLGTAAALPEAIYWKQDLFLIPYQFSSAAEPAAAQSVWLFVSKDRGASWQKISEAKPQVKAFNYRADGEGEYWFAIRTLDHQGRTWPQGAYQPELRVVVDTTIPRIESLQAHPIANGAVEISWVCSDLNLDPNSFRFEAQTDTAAMWQPVPATELTALETPAVATTALGATSSGRVQWNKPPGGRPIAIRATVSDRAGNTATYRAEINLVAAVGGPNWTLPNTGAGAPAPGVAQQPAASAPQWMAAPGIAEQAVASPVPAGPPNQSWPATATQRSPFRLSNTAIANSSDEVTSYGSLPVTAPQTNSAVQPADDREALNVAPPLPQASAGAAATEQVAEGGVEQAPATGPRFAALDPFRQTAVRRLPAASEGAQSITESRAAPPSVTPIGASNEPVAPPAQTKRVGSRTFALEYDLDETGRWGVSNVELWGTRDGGRTWQSFARDDDHRSPLVVTVDAEGLYGFRIAVDSAGSAASPPPSSGDLPELWVSVDLRRPAAQLTAIERGQGNLADHLLFRWDASDDDLEPRPISLFYSSRPTGPWSAIATSLEDTGEYAWRVERHVPARFYVRLEARDTAGNLAAFQTREPVELAPDPPGGHLRSVDTMGPTAAETNGAVR